eukprot:97750-Prymnesium_polylepis.2
MLNAPLAYQGLNDVEHSTAVGPESRSACTSRHAGRAIGMRAGRCPPARASVRNFRSHAMRHVRCRTCGLMCVRRAGVHGAGGMIVICSLPPKPGQKGGIFSRLNFGMLTRLSFAPLWDNIQQSNHGTWEPAPLAHSPHHSLREQHGHLAEALAAAARAAVNRVATSAYGAAHGTPSAEQLLTVRFSDLRVRELETCCVASVNGERTPP